MNEILRQAQDKERIVILGAGMVGKSTAFVLSIPESDCYNSQNKDALVEKIQTGSYNIFIFCLPTPTVNGVQDLSAIEQWLTVLSINVPDLPKRDSLIIIRSTILPGTTKNLSLKYGFRIAHVPEFLTEATAIEDELNPEFLVIGADDVLVREQVKELFMQSKIQPKHIILCNSVTAETIKYSLNSWFALKVIMANQIWDVAKQVGANYEKVAEVLTKHKWGSKNGWNVYHGGGRGFDGRCLPKDVSAFINAFDLPLLKEADRINKELIDVGQLINNNK